MSGPYIIASDGEKIVADLAARLREELPRRLAPILSQLVRRGAWDAEAQAAWENAVEVAGEELLLEALAELAAISGWRA